MDLISLEGIWKDDGAKITIVNTYSPCDANLKRILWDQIKQLRNAISNCGVQLAISTV